MARVRLTPAYLAMRAYNNSRLLRAVLSAAPDWQGVRVLGYHSISERSHPLCVRPQEFRAQMDAVAGSGATPVRLEEALDLLERPVTGQYVCITFDDGYRDNREAAEPVLREYGIPGTVFLTTAVVDGTAGFTWFDDPLPALTWDEVIDAERAGVLDMQAHTRTHPWLPRLSEAQAREEIAGSKRDIETRLGKHVTSFCFPAGLYGQRELELVREAGFRASVTTDPGVNDGGGLHGLRRTLVYGEDGRVAFGAKLTGRLDKAPALRAFYYRRRASA